MNLLHRLHQIVAGVELLCIITTIIYCGLTWLLSLRCKYLQVPLGPDNTDNNKCNGIIATAATNHSSLVIDTKSPKYTWSLPEEKGDQFH